MAQKSGVYITSTPVEEIVESTSNGISRKQYYHVKTFGDTGFKMEIVNPRPERSMLIHKFMRLSPIPMPTPSDEMIKRVATHDFMYIRNDRIMSGYFYMLVKRAKKMNPHMKVVLEIPTYPYENETTDLTFKQRIHLFNDHLWRRDFIACVDRIATYSRDDMIWGVPTIRFSNAIDFEHCKRGKVLETLEDKTIEIIACAQITFWHGYDRALKGLVDYYKNSKKRKYDIVLHVVGDGPKKNNPLDSYRAIVRDAGLEDKVIFHGRLVGAELEAIYNRCVIGLDSMGRHRSGVFYNSSLKGKEYLAKGLIIVSGVQTELDYDESYPYYFRVAADDSNVDFFSILEKVDKLMSENGLGAIQRAIMSYAKENFDYGVAMKGVIEYVDS